MILILRIFLLFAIAFASSFAFAATSNEYGEASCPAGSGGIKGYVTKPKGVFSYNGSRCEGKFDMPRLGTIPETIKCYASTSCTCPIGKTFGGEKDITTGETRRGCVKDPNYSSSSSSSSSSSTSSSSSSSADTSSPNSCPSGYPKFNGACQVCFNYNTDGSCQSPTQCPAGEINQGTLNGQAICKKTCSDPNQSYGVVNGVQGCYGAPTCPNPSDSFGTVNGIYGCYGSDGQFNGGNSSSPSSSGSASSASNTSTGSNTSNGSTTTNYNSIGASYPSDQACPSGFQKDGVYCVKPQGDCTAGHHEVVVSQNPFYYMCVKDNLPSSSSSSSSLSSAQSVSSSLSSTSSQSDSSASVSSSANTSTGSGNSSASGNANASNCNSEPSCTGGDPIQCAMLKQIWTNNCDGYDKKITIDSTKDNADIKSEFDKLVSENQTDLNSDGTIKGTTGTIDLAEYGQKIYDLNSIATGSSSGTCPAPRDLVLSVGSFELSYQPLCDLAQSISFLVIFSASLFGVIIIYRSVERV